MVDIDTKFAHFQSPLFAESSLSVQRALLSKGENQKLDEHIDKFLVYLGPYFLIRPAHKALEWLVYRLAFSSCQSMGICFADVIEIEIVQVQRPPVQCVQFAATFIAVSRQ